jgi:hypothetical protein
MKQRPDFVPTLGRQIIYFIYKKLPDTPPPPFPVESIGCSQNKPEVNESSYEMVGVKITVTNYGQNNRIFGIFFLVDFLFSSLTTPNVFIVMVLKCRY